DGIVRLWNRGAEAIWGYTAAEAVGCSLDIIIPERFRAAHWAAYRKAMASGETKYGGRVLPTRSVRKDGTSIYIELGFAILKDEAGGASGALAAIRDITDRYRAEKALRERLAELEGHMEVLKGRPS
ncbi:MAG: PAS domain S-box protein, partial [Chloroflexi bacterium]|nr:PAS domain S-box protein [Chloroflexota bacterium]